jgi:hypothetical protein
MVQRRRLGRNGWWRRLPGIERGAVRQPDTPTTVDHELIVTTPKGDSARGAVTPTRGYVPASIRCAGFEFCSGYARLVSVGARGCRKRASASGGSRIGVA